VAWQSARVWRPIALVPFLRRPPCRPPSRRASRRRCLTKVRVHRAIQIDAHVPDQAEIQQTYSGLQSDMQALAGKIGELEAEADEHECVIRTIAIEV
jgi:hypothetical protein